MRKAGLIVGIVVVVLLMAWARVAIDGHVSRVKADELAAAGKSDEAVGFYDRALHMYWPGSPDVARAIEVLSRWGVEREGAGDEAGALHAWRVLRSGLYAARSLYQPYPDVIAACETHIATLEARQLGDPAAYGRQLQQLQKNVDPSRGWSLAALAGFALWVGAAAAFIWRAMTPEGKLKTRPALTWAGLFVAGYLLWLVALRLA